MDVYDDEKRIASAVNYVAAWVFLGSQVGKEYRFKVSRFSGVKTIGQFRVPEEKTEAFHIVFKVTTGKAKLVFVNENGLKTLVENSFEGEKQVYLPKGMTRVRLVGLATSLELKMERLP